MQKAWRMFTRFLAGCGISLLPLASCYAQEPWLEQGYAHNDYLHKRPLLDALDHGFTHIEADVFLFKDSLVVAHWFPYMKGGRTLEKLYLAPLKYLLENHSCSGCRPVPPVTLVIDIKSAPVKTYLALRSLLKKYRGMLSAYRDGVLLPGPVNIVITGSKPAELIRRETDRLVMLDDRLDHSSPGDNDHLFALASCKYSSVLKWTGKGEIPPQEKHRLIQLVNLAHSQGKKARLWASPENERVWRELLSCGLDYINTDRLEKLNHYYRSGSSLLQAQHPVSGPLSSAFGVSQ